MTPPSYRSTAPPFGASGTRTLSPSAVPFLPAPPPSSAIPLSTFYTAHGAHAGPRAPRPSTTAKAYLPYQATGSGDVSSLLRSATESAASSKTRLKYASGFASFVDMCRVYSLDPMPHDADGACSLLLCFVERLALLGYAPSTTENYVSAVLYHWRAAMPASVSLSICPRGVPFQVAQLMSHYTAASTRTSTHRSPFSAAWLPSHASHPSVDPVLPFSLLLGFIFMLRISEYAFTEKGVMLRERDLCVRGNTLYVLIRKSKTDLRGSLHARRATGTAHCPVAAYLRYRASMPASSPDGPALRTRGGAALTRDHVNRFIHVVVSERGIDPSFYSSHSLRIGGACAAHAAGVGDAWVLREARWKSLKSLLRYIRMAHERGFDAASTMLNFHRDEAALELR